MNRKGFTLVEALVAITIFAIVVTLGLGGFTSALHTQGQVSALISAQSNASLALEQMTREIRTGYLFCDGPGNTADNPNMADCVPKGSGNNQVGCSPNGNNGLLCRRFIEFYNAQGNQVQYAIAPPNGNGSLVPGALERNQAGNGFAPITADNVVVKYLTFTIFGNTEDDHWPPRITISMGVVPSSTDPAVANDVINLQTTVSAREIDCDKSTDPAQC